MCSHLHCDSTNRSQENETVQEQIISVAAVLALALILPITVTPSVADPWYRVDDRHGATVTIMSRAGGDHVKCVIRRNYILHRNHEKNWSWFIHVQWKIDGMSNEWDFIDTHGKWCPLWNRRGWVDKADQNLKVMRGYPGPYSLETIPRTW